MKRLLYLIFALPFYSFAQEKNVASIMRVSPKADKVSAFEKALTAHAQKYHTGNWKWRVFTVESGPDAGAYHIVEGPLSWDDVDTRGDLGKGHLADYETNIAPLLMGKAQSTYSVYRADLSSVALTEYSDKIAITHVFSKPGYTEEVEDLIKSLKKAWDSSGQTVAVYESSSSGAPQIALVTRYKQGLKERTTGFRKPMKERFTQANGENSWDAYLKGIRTSVDHVWSELLFYHPELSSK